MRNVPWPLDVQKVTNPITEDGSANPDGDRLGPIFGVPSLHVTKICHFASQHKLTHNISRSTQVTHQQHNSQPNTQPSPLRSFPAASLC